MHEMSVRRKIKGNKKTITCFKNVCGVIQPLCDHYLKENRGIYSTPGISLLSAISAKAESCLQ